MSERKRLPASSTLYGPRRTPLADGLAQPPTPPFLWPGRAPVIAASGGVSSQQVMAGSLSQQNVPQQESSATGGQGIAGEVVQPGGDLLLKLQPQGINTLEQMYRALPQDSWFDPNVSPSRPLQFELGSFTVPASMDAWITFYEFQAFVQSGTDPGDFIPAAEGRFSNVLGFDITVDGRRFGNLLYQLDPVPVSPQRQTFDPPTGSQQQPPNVFSRAQASSFAANASPALSLLPMRSAIQGDPAGPFTIVAKQKSKVALSCVIFNTIPVPLAAIQGRMCGYTLTSLKSDEYLKRMRAK